MYSIVIWFFYKSSELTQFPEMDSMSISGKENTGFVKEPVILTE